MNQENQPSQTHVIGEMFDVANIAQPASASASTRGMTFNNIQLPAPSPEISSDNNGFTADNIQAPLPIIQPSVESAE